LVINDYAAGGKVQFCQKKYNRSGLSWNSMKKTNYLIFFAVIAIVFSCTKTRSSDCKLSVVKSYDKNGVLFNVTNYQYDAQGRRLLTGGGPAYYNDSVVFNNGVSTTTYYLNSDKLAFLSKQRWNPATPENIEHDNVYSYDAEGHCTQEMSVFSQLSNGHIIKDTQLINYNYQNGNLVKRSGNIMPDTYYEYTNLLSNNNSGFDGWPFLGKSSKNLAARVRNDSGVVLAEYQYQFDHAGNVLKMTFTGTNGSGWIEYGYNCN
jgi:hypothetical protein